MRLKTFAVVAIVAMAAPAQAVGLTDLCSAAIENASGRYVQCLLTAESRYSKTLDAEKRDVARSKCATKQIMAMSKAVDAYGAIRCSASSDSDYRGYLTGCVDQVEAAAVPGGQLPGCGNGLLDVAGEHCDGTDFGGTTCESLGFLGGGTLYCTSECRFNTAYCLP